MDSRFHRFWVCEHFAEERLDVPPDVLRRIPTLPDFLTSYGWSLRSVTMMEWICLLDRIEVPHFSPLHDLARAVHVFTDGTCLNQSHASCRVAAWAVVLAGFHHSVDASVLASGPLPGILQSSFRAEIFAVLRTLSLMKFQTGVIYIWSDCNAVVRRMQRLLDGIEPKPNSAHSDLWMSMFDALADFGPGQVVVRKVAAHQLVSHALSPLEEWCTTHNCIVDAAAALAQWKRPPGFWNFYEKHVRMFQACQTISRHVQRVLLRISRAAVVDDGLDDGEVRDDIGVPLEVPPGTWKALAPLAIPAPAVHRYGDEIVRALLSWYWQSISDQDEVRWVAQYQLYIDFMLSGEQGPVKIDVWRAGSSLPHSDLLSISFLTRVRWFSRALKECLKHHGQGFHFCYGRPHSRALHLHTGCLALPWPAFRLQAVDQWILKHCPGGVRRTTRAAVNIPVAQKDPSFPDVLLTCA